MKGTYIRFLYLILGFLVGGIFAIHLANLPDAKIDHPLYVRVWGCRYHGTIGHPEGLIGCSIVYGYQPYINGWISYASPIHPRFKRLDRPFP